MRSPIFLVTAMSCMVIAAGFFSRDNYLVGSVIGLVGVYYVAKAVLGDRLAILAGRRSAGERPDSQIARNGATGDQETAALRAELEGMLAELRRRMVSTRAFFVLTAGIAAVLFFVNWPLAVAIVPFAGFFGFLFFRNAKAVALLERNL